jgi:hypothetical protein
MLKEKDFVAFLSEAGRYDKTAEKCTVCGIILPSFSDYLLRGPAGALGTKYNVLSYSEQGLTVIPINNITGNMLPDESAFIPGEKITSMKTVPKAYLPQTVCWDFGWYGCFPIKQSADRLRLT